MALKIKAQKEKSQGSFVGSIYNIFNKPGNLFYKIFYSHKGINIDEALRVAGIKLYPEAYYSAVAFAFIIVLIAMIPIAILTGFYPLLLTPFMVVLLGYFIPKLLATDRASKLDGEVPFAGTYMSVMATGGLSPYASLRRLTKSDLLPNLAKEVKNIEVEVEIKGVDPVSAMENSAQNLPSKPYRDLMLGYSSTLRTGGDVIHYLQVRTENMFTDMAAKVRAFGDRAATLMESYITLSILVTLSLTIIYMVSIAFSSFWEGGFSADTFLLYSYFLVPGLSIAFIYLADSNQIHQPINEWGPYKVFFATMPIMIILMLTMFTPYAAPGLELPFAEPFKNALSALTSAVGLERGYEAAFGLSIALLVGTLPAAIAHNYYAKKGKGIEADITNFLRDLTEARKTGASPEKCIDNLAGRKYGQFTQPLILAARQIRWGLSFKAIYNSFREKIKSWLSLINIFVLVDAIEVGGGTPESLETLTSFSEKLTQIEKERKSMLRPLVFMPYVGAAILLFSSIIFLGFMRTTMTSYGGQSMSFVDFATLILPPLVLQSFLTGLVTGKISSGVASSGFLHSVILVIMAMVLMVILGTMGANAFSFG